MFVFQTEKYIHVCHYLLRLKTVTLFSKHFVKKCHIETDNCSSAFRVGFGFVVFFFLHVKGDLCY